MSLEPKASWFSSKCDEVQWLTGHIRVKHCFNVSHYISTKSRQILNTRSGLKRSELASETMGDTPRDMQTVG